MPPHPERHTGWPLDRKSKPHTDEGGVRDRVGEEHRHVFTTYVDHVRRIASSDASRRHPRSTATPSNSSQRRTR